MKYRYTVHTPDHAVCVLAAHQIAGITQAMQQLGERSIETLFCYAHYTGFMTRYEGAMLSYKRHINTVSFSNTYPARIYDPLFTFDLTPTQDYVCLYYDGGYELQEQGGQGQKLLKDDNGRIQIAPRAFPYPSAFTHAVFLTEIESEREYMNISHRIARDLGILDIRLISYDDRPLHYMMAFETNRPRYFQENMFPAKVLLIEADFEKMA